MALQYPADLLFTLLLGAGPLEDRGTVSDDTVLAHLEPLRQAPVWPAGEQVPAGATDLRLYRVMVMGGREATVEVRSR